MTLSTLDLFSIGIGPSSSHTVGPMRAAAMFVRELDTLGLTDQVVRVCAELFGSLALTGRGHGTDKAVILGLLGDAPESVDTTTADARVDEVSRRGSLLLGGTHPLVFERSRDLVMHMRRSLPGHPTGMSCVALDGDANVLLERIYYSVGGGFVVDPDAVANDRTLAENDVQVRHPFSSAAELLAICAREGLSISDVMMANETAWRPEEETRARLLEIWAVMQECVTNGCHRTEPVLPGGLGVRRRAPRLLTELVAEGETTDPLRAMDWVNLYALAVNEENASGGRVVTAPTNGAAGIIPAVLHYYRAFVPGADDEGVIRFLLTAAAVGILFKTNASISGAEVGCQGEVGSACSMAAAGLAEVLGGTPPQVENAAEIGIEHNLGLTCDPVGGLVQVPCIERNAVASVKAINAARMALRGDGHHQISLDAAVLTMRVTGADMKSEYKETSQGGLAVNYTEC